MEAKTVSKKINRTAKQHARDQGTELPLEGSPEFERRCAKAWDKVIAKYAWTAQSRGIVLRNNPLKLPPYQDYVFERMMKVEHGFKYRASNGRRKVWYPNLGEIFSRYLDDGDRDVPFTMAERIEFIPDEPEITYDADGCRVLNLWRPPPWELQEGAAPEPRPFLEHVSYLLDGNPEAIDHVLNFIAHLVQRPRERIGHALLITSEAKGIGKSTLGAIVRQLVGEQNSRVTQTKDLKGQFDGWLIGKLVVQVDEVYEGGNWTLTDKLKPIITEPKVSVNIKYGPQMEIENYARLILFSNHTAPITIEEGDRRYFVFNSNAQPREDGYYDALHRYIETNEGMNAIYSFLRKRDLSNFNPYRRPPMTEAKRDIIEVSEHSMLTYITEAVASGHLLERLGREFTYDQLLRLLQYDGFGAAAKNTKELGEALKAAGVEKGRKSIAGKKPRVYRLPDGLEALQDRLSEGSDVPADF